MTEPVLNLHPALDGYALSFVTQDLTCTVTMRERIAVFPTLATARQALRAAETAAGGFTGGTTDAVSGFPGSLPASRSKGQIP